MKVLINPPVEKWSELVTRPVFDLAGLEESVKNIFGLVRAEGDQALVQLTQKFDGQTLNDIEVKKSEIEEASGKLSQELKSSILLAAENIQLFHKAQLRENLKIETMPGVTCERMHRPIQNIGLYIPGGSAPLFSTVLMLAIPAQVAGCKNIFLCSPPSVNGHIHPAILFAAHATGVNRIFNLGGAQAIAAMTYGTETISKADKIFGPGNQYVTMAKMIAQQSGVAIDLPAGPSEVLVIADENARPDFIAADLLSQAEHGEDSQVVLCTTSERLSAEVIEEIDRQLQDLPRIGKATESLKHSSILIFPDIETCIKFSNAYAPEHLIIQTEKPRQYLNKITEAGSVFLGAFTPESAGDYASGTNHTLPTNGYARMHGGVSTDSFLKYITVQEISMQGLKNIGPVVEEMARGENLEAHRNAVSVRLKSFQ
ncbi:MAG: histidinol dehydrogenase [Cyclobacteriaceae bacterium]